MLLECPRGCNGGSSNRQHPMTDIMLAKINDQRSAELMKTHASTLRRCSDCGCVHIEANSGRRVLGTYSDDGWKPV